MAVRDALHEDLTRTAEARSSSDRAFGVVFTVVFGGVWLLPLWAGHPLRAWPLAVAGLFLALAILRPSLLAPLNRAWLLLGRSLHRLVSPVILGGIFFLCFVPLGWLMRMAGKRPLDLGADPDQVSYWKVRVPPGPLPGTMKNQF